MQFLMLILGLAGNADSGGTAAGGGAWWQGSSGSAALFELLARSLADHPAALDDLARIIDRLSRTEAGRAVMPDGFLPLWSTLLEARDLLGSPK